MAVNTGYAFFAVLAQLPVGNDAGCDGLVAVNACHGGIRVLTLAFALISQCGGGENQRCDEY